MEVGKNSEYEKISLLELQELKDDLTKHDIPVLRINKENKFVVFPHEQISILLENEKYTDVELYLPKNYRTLLEGFKISSEVKVHKVKTPEESEKEMTTRLVEISRMDYDTKVSTLEKYNNDLLSLGKNHIINPTLAQEIINVGNDAGLITKINMFESIQKIKNNQDTSESIKRQNKAITDKTINLVRTIADILVKNEETQIVFTKLRTFSDGGIMDHCNRVFISYINFLDFYNNLINRSSSLIHRVRSEFVKKYKKYYDDVVTMYSKDGFEKEFKSVGDVIDRGMKSLPREHICMYAVGALLHDIGKVKDLDYFEGATGRDTDRIQKHLFNSYALITQTAEYPLEVILTVAFHHEYYGYGYGPFNTFYNIKIESQPKFRFKSILTYEASTSDSCEALAYFPAKVLEIIDVYDALIDPARKYRLGKVFSPIEALTIMREDFIEKHVKLDPILFDIFVDFLSQNGVEDNLSAAYVR